MNGKRTDRARIRSRALVLGVLLGTFWFLQPGAAGADGDVGTTLFQEPPTAADVLEALGEQPQVKYRSLVKTRAIVIPGATPATAAPSSSAPDVGTAAGPPAAAPVSEQASAPSAAPSEQASALPAASVQGNAVERPRPRKNLALPLTFRIGSAQLTEAAKRYLDPVGMALQQKTSLDLAISGHTDITGSVATNRVLSRQRAEAVRDYLVERFQIDPGRMTVQGEGSVRLLFKNRPTAAENRRVEFVKVER